MNVPKPYSYYGRIGFILLASGGFFLLSLYARAWTEHNIFPILFPAVALSAWVGGRLGGLISTAALSLCTAYYHLPPKGLTVADPADMVRLGTFVLSGAFVAWLSGALQENQRIMMATLRSIGDAVIATDRRGCIRFLNPIAETLTGWSQKEAKGRPVTEVFQSVNTETGAGLEVPVPELLRGVVTLPENIYLISKSGAQVPIDDSLAPVQIDSGRILGSILVFRDATNRRQNEAALVESERQRMQAQRMEAIGRLAGGIAHDFNNLLTVIIGHADLALKQVGSIGPGRSGLEEILNAGQKAAGLTRQLLVFSRGQPLKLEVIDLNHVVTNIEKMLRRLIGEDIELVSALSDESVCVKADVGQMEQVIVNLATNARDAMPGGGRLTLETTVRKPDESSAQSESGAPRTDYAVLRVIDTGIGMDPETKLRVFEPFFTTKEIGKGTGLGLSITDSIIKNHNGDLRVQSDPGKGSVFEICLPLVEGLPQEIRSPFNPDERLQHRATILVVEDNDEVRHLTRDILTSLGHLVLEAPNGEEGFLAAQSYAGRIDLMVSDLVMPGLSGVELAKRLASLRPETRVLYISGYAEHNLTASVLRDPAVGYLQKPFTPAELVRRVNEMVTGSKKSRGEDSL